MINAMSVGKDYSFVFVDGDTNAVVALGDVQNVQITAQKHDIKSSPYNGPPRFGFIPDGYKFSFTITRIDSALEDFQLAANKRFDDGNNTRSGYLNETIKNPDGSTSRYQYTGFVFWVGDIGEISRDKAVSVKAEGYASTKEQLA